MKIEQIRQVLSIYQSGSINKAAQIYSYHSHILVIL